MAGKLLNTSNVPFNFKSIKLIFWDDTLSVKKLQYLSVSVLPCLMSHKKSIGAYLVNCLESIIFSEILM